jgi:glycosyltransferase involved in cell wall biosynthesis
MIVRILGQNGGGTRVYGEILNKYISKKYKIINFLKDYKKIEDRKYYNKKNIKNFYSLNIFKIFFFILINKKKIKYIHSHLRNATIIGFFLSQIFCIKHFVSVHGIIYNYDKKYLSLKDKFIIFIFKISILKAKFTFFNSYFTLREIKKICNIKGNKKNFKVIYLGTTKIKNKKITKKNKKLNIVIVGDLINQKNSLQIIKIAKKINQSPLKSKICIHVYGDGYLKKKIINEIYRYKLNDMIKIYGKINSINTIFENKQLHLIFSKKEGFGRVTIEAMSAGIPTLAFNSGAHKEVIKNYKSGLLFNNLTNCLKLINNIYLKKIKFNKKIIIKEYLENFSEKKFIDKINNYINS